MSLVSPCNDCADAADFGICKVCYGKAKTRGRVEGLKKALRILENREATAKALGCGDEYLAPFQDLRIFLNAELFRTEHPEQASCTSLEIM